MADSLKARVGRVIASGLHAVLDRLEDRAPDVVMEQTLREADGVIDDVRHELGIVAANRHLSQQQHASLNAQHARLAEQIDQAMAQGRDELVRAGVARQLDIEAQLPVLENTLSEFVLQERELQGFLSALLAKKREMADALSDFRKSRAATQQTSAKAASTGAELRIGAVSDAFDRLYERQTGLSATTRSSTLQQAAQLHELDELVRDNKIAERIAQLKAGRA